ncbi:MAG TPA: oxalate/formate MFS antiporter [Methylorubrum populi]|uniref:Oxalate/formate MFS antiporter n=1 Tax=Methylorubrum populi TaxID=223967 RepID=A0A921E1V8_9HYPH|nr:oxalate/formate MFS antiporter [Methylorubrum populi]
MHTVSDRTRWTQLGLGLLVMMTISSPQYVWTLFVKPFQATTGASLAAVQVAFTMLIVLQTFFSPVQGWLIERFSAKGMIALGAALSGLGWVAASYTDTLWGLYATYGLLCGLGTGIVYVGVVGLMVRWFPERRGFAAGVVAAGYGMGAIATTFPITDMIAASGYRHTLFVFGAVMAVIGVVAALGLRSPKAGETPAIPADKVASAARDVAPSAMLKTPLFWLMFAMMAMMSTGGLMVVAQFSAFAKEFGVADALVFGFAALPFALTFDRITNGLTRPFFGWVSDHAGRENTMAVAFALEAVAIGMLLMFRENAYAFALLSGVVFFAWGEIFSLFPSTLTDTFGTKHATTNYGFLYMAQGLGSLLGGPVAALIHDAVGSWVPVFGIAIGLDLAVAALAWFVLKPARRAYLGVTGPAVPDVALPLAARPVAG